MNETLDKKNLQENTVNACHKCGTELESVKYCAECKTVIRHMQTDINEEKCCSKCGQVMTNAKYCANCKTVIKQKGRNDNEGASNKVDEGKKPKKISKILISLTAVVVIVATGIFAYNQYNEMRRNHIIELVKNEYIPGYGDNKEYNKIGRLMKAFAYGISTDFEETTVSWVFGDEIRSNTYEINCAIMNTTENLELRGWSKTKFTPAVGVSFLYNAKTKKIENAIIIINEEVNGTIKRLKGDMNDLISIIKRNTNN